MMDGSKSQQDESPAVLPLPGKADSSPPEAASQKPVLQKVEQRGSQRRRRKPPAWANRVANSCIAAKHFLREKLPNSILRRRRALMTAVVSFLIHLVSAFLLTLWLLPQESRDSMFAIISGQVEDVVLEEPLEVVKIVRPEKITDLNLDSTMKQM
ncbi:MAG: hypothetical protein WKF77_32505, partial [Planctomycetaceae bacterium]